MTDRKSIDQITSDELDALYDDRDRLAALHEAHLRVERRLAREGLAAEATVERVRYAVMNQSYLVSLDESIQAALDGPAQRAATATDPDPRTATGP